MVDRPETAHSCRVFAFQFDRLDILIRSLTLFLGCLKQVTESDSKHHMKKHRHGAEDASGH